MEVDGKKRRAVTERLQPSKKARLSPTSDEGSLDDTSYSPRSTDAPSIADTSRTSRSSKRPKKYLCTYDDCDKAFDRPVRLEAHIRTHTNDRAFACEEDGCDKRFFKVEHLKAHVANIHTNEANFVCTYVLTTSKDGEQQVCNMAFTTSSRLKRHLAVHEAKEDLKCHEPDCGQVFRKMDTLQRHIRKDHLKEHEVFRCTAVILMGDGVAEEECGRTFSSAVKLKTHESQEHAGNRYFCEICSPPRPDPQTPEQDSVGFPTYIALQAHFKAVHPPTCLTCNLAFGTPRALTAHIDIEHGTLEARQTIPCTYPGCERSFTRKGNLNVHYQNVHVKEKKFTCGEFDLTGNEKCPDWDGMGCGMKFGTKANLEEHVRTRHLDLPSLIKRKPRRERKLDPSVASPMSPDAMDIDVKPEPVDPSTAAPDVNALSLLTGQGYSDSRSLTCWTQTCGQRFLREYDLAAHMELIHGWDVQEINERLAEEQALNGGAFWVGGMDGGFGDEEYSMFGESLPQLHGHNREMVEPPYDAYEGESHGGEMMAVDPMLA